MGKHPVLLPFSAIFSIVLLASVVPLETADSAPIARWLRPVAGEVVRPFDPPRSRFGAGHVGVDLAAPLGTPVHAAGPGVVSFAGLVAGASHVVVAHAGDLRTSYSFLLTTTVRRGDQVLAGDIVGTTGGISNGHDGKVLHLGLRSGDAYVDPMQLFGAVDLASVVHLAPTTTPPRSTSRSGERRGLLAGLAHGAGAVVRAAGSGLVAAGSGIREFAASRFPLPTAVARGLNTWLSQRGECDERAPAADGTGGSDHRVMILAGLDSSSTNGGPSTPLPAKRLGYAPSDISYFSYAADGGDYTVADTRGSLRIAARRLGAQLRDLERREPGREVDLIGHSQGGVIMTEFLLHVYDPGDPSYPPLGFGVALGSPLIGSTAATTSAALERSAVGRLALDVAHGAGAPDRNARAVADLQRRSDVMRDQERATLPPTFELTTLGAAQDIVAPAKDTRRPGAQQRTLLPHGLNGHSGIVTDDSALQATRAAIEGKQLPCQSLTTIVTGEIVSTAIVTAERGIADVGAFVAARAGK